MSRPDAERADLEARILAWMRDPAWHRDEARFDTLARALFAWQLEHCTPYARFCRARGRTPDRVTSWRELPPVPTGAFKEVELRCFPAERTLKTFRTSGTATERRGALHLDTLELYEASLLPSFRRFLLPDAARLPIRVLAPPPEEVPDSSLSHMLGCVVRKLGAPGSGFDVKGGRLRVEPLLDVLEQTVARDTPLLLAGTAFGFVHLLDALQEQRLVWRLPAGSRVMETGGFKGRSRELGREALRAALGERLGVPPTHVVNQYGMTELGSQFYDSSLCEPGAPRRKLGPPWTRVRIVDPQSGEDARPGEVGIVVVVDLANTGSVLALQTADLGRRVEDGFEVLGRAPGAEARGCSMAADAMLGETEP